MSGGRKGVDRISETGDAGEKLLARITTILGSPAEARLRLTGALSEAGLSEVPDEPALVMRFVHGFLVAPLSSLCGPRIVALFVEDLEHEILPRGPAEGHKKERDDLRKRRVGLLDDEPFRRSSVARALIHAGLDVVVLDADQILTADVDALVVLGDEFDSVTLRDVSAPLVLARPSALACASVARSSAPRDVADAVLSLLATRDS